MNPQPLTTVICSYTLSPVDIAALLAAYGNRLNIYFHGIIVVNGEHNLDGVDDHWETIRGSNSEQDFSAYREGLLALDQSEYKFNRDVVLFINDTAFEKHNALDIIRNLTPYIQPVADCTLPAMAGKADYYDNICYANPWNGLPIYLSTFFFLLNLSALPLITCVLDSADKNIGDKSIDLDDPSWGEGLEKAFRVYLRCHLTYSGTSNSWYQLAEKRSNRRLISQKARAVYFEHRLSGEIGATGVLFNIYPTVRKKMRFFLREQQAKFMRTLLSH